MIKPAHHSFASVLAVVTLLTGFGVTAAGCSGENNGVETHVDGGASPSSSGSSGSSGASDGAAPKDADARSTCTLPDLPNATNAATVAAWSQVVLSDTAKYPNAVCNDGSPATYRIRRNPTSTRWLIWLDGGGYCADDASCQNRYGNPNKSGQLMSSIPETEAAAQGKLGAAAAGDGVTSPDAAENPTFYNANIIKVPYCSSDIYMGDRAGNPSAPISSVTHWHFRGRAIVKGIITNLLNEQGMSSASDVVLSGGSAGGIGTIGEADDVGALLPKTTRYLAMANAGFFIDYPAFDPATGLPSTQTPTLLQQIAVQSRAVWGGRGDASCDAQATTEEAKVACYSAETVTRGHVTTPPLLVQSLFDINQTSRLGVDLSPDTGKAPTTAQQTFTLGFAKAMGDRLAKVDSIHSYFADWAHWHVTLNGQTAKNTMYATTKQTIDGRLLNEVVDAWHAKPCSPVRLMHAPVAGTP